MSFPTVVSACLPPGATPVPCQGSGAPGAPGAPSGPLPPLCLYKKDHSSVLVAQLQLLRGAAALTDLVLVCQDAQFKAHKVVMAAAATFLKEQFCRANVMVPVIVKLEDFGMELKKEAVGYIVEFVYRGEVVVPGARFNDVCVAVHALGVHGLVDLLPDPAKSGVNGPGGAGSVGRKGKTGTEGFVQLTAQSINNAVASSSANAMAIAAEPVPGTSSSNADATPLIQQSQQLPQPLQQQHQQHPQQQLQHQPVGDHIPHLPIGLSHGESYDVIVDLTDDGNSSANLHSMASSFLAGSLCGPVPSTSAAAAAAAAASGTASNTFGLFPQQAECPFGSSSHQYQQQQSLNTAPPPPTQAHHIYHQPQQQQQGDGFMFLQYGTGGTTPTAASTFGTPGHDIVLQDAMGIATSMQNMITAIPTSSRGKQIPLVAQQPQQQQSQAPVSPSTSPAINVTATTPTCQNNEENPPTASTPVPGNCILPTSSSSETTPITTTTSTVTAPATPSSAGKLRVINQGLLNTSNETNIQQSRSSTPMSTTPSNLEADALAITTQSSVADHLQLDIPPPSVAVSHWPGSPAWNNQSELILYEDDNSDHVVWPGPVAAQGNWTMPTTTAGASSPAVQSWNVPEGQPEPATSQQDETSQPPLATEKKAVLALQKMEQGAREVSEAPDASENEPSATATWHRSEPPPAETAAPSPITPRTRTPSPVPGASMPTIDKPFSPFRGEGNMLAIRSGVPLALMQPDRKRKRSSVVVSREPPKSPRIDFAETVRKRNLTGGSTGGGKRGDLGVRKDLTLPSAPTAEEDNVFQSEDSRDIVADDLVPTVDNELTIDGTGEEDSLSPLSGSDIEEEEIDDDDEEEDEDLDKANFQKKVKCLECSMILDSNEMFEEHVRTMHRKKEVISCLHCDGIKFKTKSELKAHMANVHGQAEVYRCDQCNYETPVKGSYVRHNCVKNAPRLPCPHCTKEFKSKVGLRLHVKTHAESGSKLFKCSECDFTTPQKVSIVRHLASMHKKDLDGNDLKPDFKCTQCDDQFVSARLLRAHSARKHTAPAAMAHRCTYPDCAYAAVEKSSLTRHVRFIHTGERPFTCGDCGFATHTAGAMVRHARAHTGERPYVCEEVGCNAAYADKKRLRDHAAREHETDDAALKRTLFECDECGQTFGRKDNLKVHIERKHGEGDDDEELERDPRLKSRRKILVVDAPVASSSRSHIVGHINHDGSIRPVAPTASSQARRKKGEKKKSK